MNYPHVYAICRADFPTSVFEIAQELGRCGRGCSNKNDIVTDSFHLFLSLDNFIYLSTRLFLPSSIVTSIVTSILISHKEIAM